MNFKFKLTEPNSPEILIEIPFWSGKRRVYANGKEVERSKENGKPFPIPMTDGSVKKIFLKSSFLDYVPKVIVDNTEILLAEKLVWHEYILAGIPLILLFFGGAIGGFLGALASMLNLRIIRTDRSTIIKVLSILGITILAIICYLAVASVFQMLTSK